MIDRMLINWMKAFVAFVLTLIVLGFCITSFRCAYADELKQCEQYRERVEVILKSEAVSIDYYYLMVAESRCTEKAVSEKGAAGFWQLMPGTLKHYGCDDAFDLECSTRAAARYLRHLHSVFGTFDDVIIAYNMGGHNYKRNGATKQAKGLLFKVNSLKARSNNGRESEGCE